MSSPPDLSGWLNPPTDSTTNPSAPNAWPTHIDRLAVWSIYLILLILVIPFALIKTTSSYLLFGPRHKDFDFRTQVTSDVLYWVILFLFLFKLPGKDMGETKVASSMRRKGMQVQVEMIPACPPELIIGWAKHSIVKPMTVPGFMIWPTTLGNNKTGEKRAKGFEPAKKGEKIILYFVGGGFISGHPLLSHLAWTVSELLDTRILCELDYRSLLDIPDLQPPSSHLN
jgi:hypothetical protein